MKSSATSSARPSGSDAGARLRRRPQLSEEVAAHLRELIMTASIRPGDPVRMDLTAQRLGVSVTPVREALLLLRGEGMVHLLPHKGYVVAELSRTDIEDLFWLQGQMAVRLAIRTAAAITEEQIDDLETLNDELRQAISSDDSQRITLAEFEFHRVHNHIAGSEKLAWFLLHATRYTPAALYATDPDWGAVAVDSHARLIEAYRAGDSEQIVEQTRRQFDDGAARLTRHLETTGIWDD